MSVFVTQGVQEHADRPSRLGDRPPGQPRVPRQGLLRAGRWGKDFVKKDTLKNLKMYFF